MTRSKLERCLRRLSFELAAAQNALRWAGDDLERGGRLEDVRAARERYLDAWSLRQELIRQDFFGPDRETS